MQIKYLRVPTDDDWRRALMLARGTKGSGVDISFTPGLEWRQRLIKSLHSPVRTIMYTVMLCDIPYYSAMHIRTHHIGIEHYISSQRAQENRGEAPQNALVNHIIDFNPQGLVNVAVARLCQNADETTRGIIRDLTNDILTRFPEFELAKDLFMPKCRYDAKNCPEFCPCGYFKL